jgi:hypothetical protein
MALPQGPNQRCSLDFVADALDWDGTSGCSPSSRSARALLTFSR